MLSVAVRRLFWASQDNRACKARGSLPSAKARCCKVHVIMTSNACRPCSRYLQTLNHNPVVVDTFATPTVWIEHVSLAQRV